MLLKLADKNPQMLLKLADNGQSKKRKRLVTGGQ